MKAFLDACVLFPPIMRRMLIAMAEAGELDPLWSDRVLEEWRYAVRQKLGAAEAALAEGEAALLRARWPEASVPPQPDAEAALTLPDRHDAHVLACAVAGGAGLLVTLNLRDFPARKLRDLGVAPIHPDALLWEIQGRNPNLMRDAAQRAVSTFGGPTEPPFALIKRGGMPRLAKALRRAEG